MPSHHKREKRGNSSLHTPTVFSDNSLPERRVQPAQLVQHITMAFAIEVPGEAAPLTPQQVYLALQSAGSSQQLSIQAGSQQLQTWETRPGYYSLLQVCYNAPISCR